MYGLGALLLGCGFFESNDSIDDPLSVPLRDGWRTVLEAGFPTQGDDAINLLRVGGSAHEGNFANRGDILVDFTDAETITLRMRPFSRSEDERLVADELDRLSLWAFVTEGNAPLRPEEMVVSRPCIGDDGNLRDRCALRLIYDGALQPMRLGADLWLTLPRSYQGELTLYTEDNAIDGDYLNRGNVCIEANQADVTVSMDSGTAFVKASSSGRTTLKGEASNVKVDLPADVVATLRVTYASFPEIDALCSANFDVAGAIEEDSSAGTNASDIVVVSGPQPRPGPSTVTINASLRDCQWLTSTESPREFDAQIGADREPELMGSLDFCNGCLPDPCATLLPGFSD